MRTTLTVALIIFCCCNAFSQSPEKAEKIKKYLDAAGTTKVFNTMMDNLIETYKKSYNTVDTTFWNEFRKDLTANGLIQLMIPVYDKYLTDKDLDALITFYTSPAGKKLAEVQPLMVRESMEAGAEWGKSVGLKVMERLKEKGYTQ
jgi:hypothetical protein